MIHTLTLELHPDPDTLDLMLRTFRAFREACALVTQTALKANTRDRGRLHALVYRKLCPLPTSRKQPHQVPLPSQFAGLAIGRVIHQLKAKGQGQANPYPRRSYDVDARTLALEISQGCVRMAHLGSWNVRGSLGRQNRLEVPVALQGLSKEDLQLLTEGRFVAGHILLPPPGRPSLLLRIDDEDLAPGTPGPAADAPLDPDAPPAHRSHRKLRTPRPAAGTTKKAT